MKRERVGRALGPMGARERKKEGEERVEMKREREGRALGPMSSGGYSYKRDYSWHLRL